MSDLVGNHIVGFPKRQLKYWSSSYKKFFSAIKNQMVNEGKMHVFMRMFWAKILECTSYPTKALEIAIYCKFGNFYMTFILRIFYFRILSKFLKS